MRRRLLAVGGAVLAATVIGVIAPAAGVDLRVDMRNGQPPMTIGLPLTIGFSLTFALLGWASLALLERFTVRARTTWTILAVAVLLLSFLPLLAAEATAGTKAMLALMHVTVAAVLIPMLRGDRSSGKRSVDV
ncbi:DUF6069 family protein [Streptosporangium sp. NPDC000396]|uniref:DUF6069 family protein n=1 Tax=Streptosporangium sp. NPDC000396 TaxID=3366185 RepID=UPI0036AFD561